MEENMEFQTQSTGKRVALIVLGGLAALIVLVYMGLCIYVGASGTILPRVYAGNVALGGMDREQAGKTVEAWLDQEYTGVTYVLNCGASTVSLSGDIVAVDSAEVAQQAYMVGRCEPFLKRGAVILSHLLHGWNAVPCPVELSAEGERQLAQALKELKDAEDVPLVETVWSVDGDALSIVRGVTGVSVDEEGAKAALLEAMQLSGDRTVSVPMVETQPAPLDLNQVRDQIYALAADAYVERDERGGVRVVPHVVGVDFDAGQAQTQFEALKQGERGRIPLTVTQPELPQTKLERMLFADVLGECTTYASGTQYRLNNVQVAAKAMDGLILMPGEVFSYNGTLGPRTTANGYLPAPAYIAGQTVDDVGGGICQNSSTLYLAVLRANLEVVERTNHMFTVGYVPDGLDATVAYNALDFKFRNNTGFPIRIESKLSGRDTIIKLHGTDADGVTVKMETNTLSTTPYKVTYKPDTSIARGKTEVDVTAYTGKKIQVFRCVYDSRGNLISRTQESTNNYRHRDKVILYNPADAESLGLVDENGVVHSTVQPKKPAPEPAPVPVQPEQEVSAVTPQPEPEQPVQAEQPSEAEEQPLQQDAPAEGV